MQNGAGGHNVQGAVTLSEVGGRLQVSGQGDVTVTNPRNQTNPTGWIVPQVTIYVIPETGGYVRMVSVATAMNYQTGVGTWPLTTIGCPVGTYKLLAFGHYSDLNNNTQWIGSGWKNATSTAN